LFSPRLGAARAKQPLGCWEEKQPPNPAAWRPAVAPEDPAGIGSPGEPSPAPPCPSGDGEGEVAASGWFAISGVLRAAD